MKNNKEQERAIKTIDKNLSVIAGAGTGKTKVLTERFVYILENGDLPRGREIESIIAITFTKKASQEMIERIRSEIRKNFDKGEKWRRYYRDIEKANISTIHSFCLNILKENVIHANLDPMFEVIEEYEARKMLRDSIRSSLDSQLEEDGNLYNLLKIMKVDKAHFLIDDIVSIYDEIRTRGVNIGQIKDITMEYLGSLEEIDSGDLDSIRQLTNSLIENASKRAKIRKVMEDPQCVDFLKGQDVDDLARVLSFIEENIGSNKKEQASIDLLKDYIEKALASLERENIVYYRSLFDLLERVDVSYKGKKDLFGGLDYEDLQIKTDRLLDDEEILSKYQDKYKYIMIDEFQDTNELQKRIFYKIASVEENLDRENLFIVGDPKQSIYGFRGADLQVFYNVVDYIETTNDNLSLNLNKNYRTVDTVLDFVNNIFSKIMARDYSALTSNKKSKRDIDIEVISKEDLEIPDGVSASEYHRTFESEEIAKRIHQLVASGEYRYKDFAMLFRATTRNHIYERALNKYAIPYYNIGSKGFFKQQEVLDMISALKSINNIEDKISSIGFLRSNFIGLDDNTIYYIFKDSDKQVYDVMKELLDDSRIGKIQKEKLNQAVEIYREMKIYRHVYSLNQIVDKLIKKTLYIQTTLLKENGRQKFANILKFINMAKEYQEKYTGNIKEFLAYIDEISENDENLGQIETDNTDAVKMLTIHKSKGLEFPVVIIPEMSSKGGGGFGKFLIDEDKGVAINVGKSNPIYKAIKDEQREKDLEESKRVLYVAMTRAEEKLILGNQGSNAGFKKMIIDILDGENYRSIDEIDLAADEKAPIKTIGEELIAVQADDIEKIKADLPLLYGIEDYDRSFNNRFSISKYMVFRECKRKYFLQEHININHIEDRRINRQRELEMQADEIEEENEIENELGPVEKGLIVHEFCETYRYGKDERQIIQNIMHSRGLVYSEDIYTSIKPYILNYLKHYSEDADEIYYEREFFLKLNNAYVSGYIDKMTINQEKISIMDFKTNKLYNKRDLIQQYTPQIQFYAYVAKEILDLPLESASILFLENGEKIDIDIDDSVLLRNVERVQEFIDFTIKNNSIHQYEKTDRCSDYCKYRSICNFEEE